MGKHSVIQTRAHSWLGIPDPLVEVSSFRLASWIVGRNYASQKERTPEFKVSIWSKSDVGTSGMFGDDVLDLGQKLYGTNSTIKAECHSNIPRMHTSLPGHIGMLLKCQAFLPVPNNCKPHPHSLIRENWQPYSCLFPKWPILYPMLPQSFSILSKMLPF